MAWIYQFINTCNVLLNILLMHMLLVLLGFIVVWNISYIVSLVFYSDLI